jgi:hypothetical protein
MAGAKALAARNEPVPWDRLYSAVVESYRKDARAVLDAAARVVPRRHAQIVLQQADDLAALMDQLNEAGIAQVAVAVLDHGGVLYLAYGEERSSGGESMDVWLQPADAGSGDYDGQESCECGYPRVMSFFLSEASYPVTAWLNTEQATALAENAKLVALLEADPTRTELLP